MGLTVAVARDLPGACAIMFLQNAYLRAVLIISVKIL
jgi:hypothetical protein